MITRASYGTYGELLGVTGEAGGDTLRFLYNGRYGVQTEGNTLYYMRARYYNQDARRFVNLDPVRGELTNTQSLNRYAYVQGNPVRATDPLGLSPEEVEREIDVHLILGLLGCIPFAGAIFSAYDAYLYHKEGNYIMMAGSIVATIGSICGTGGAAAKYLSKCGIISPKTATIVQKTLMGISLGSGVGYTGVLFGNSISKAIDEKEENGTISSATWKEIAGTAAIHAITTALGVEAAKRMSSPVLKETAKNTTPSTPTTTSATGTIAEVLDDGVGSVGRRKGGLELDLQFFAREKGSKSGTGAKTPMWKGSGPAPGVLGINANSTSNMAIKNYAPKEGMEFVFDASTNTFVVGKNKYNKGWGSPHQKLAESIGANQGASTTLGGVFSRGSDGKIYTNENSGHFGKNWTPALRTQFIETMRGYGVEVIHDVWK